ncbi:copper transpport protein [Microbotryomycetes sp. JL221]|nr:copper transpport protein [Microbotryomycetes sp. JL221]
MMCKMNMVWNTDPRGICLVFPSLQIGQTSTSVWAWLIALSFLAISYEYTRLYALQLDRQLKSTLRGGGANHLLISSRSPAAGLPPPNGSASFSAGSGIASGLNTPAVGGRRSIVDGSDESLLGRARTFGVVLVESYRQTTAERSNEAKFGLHSESRTVFLHHAASDEYALIVLIASALSGAFIATEQKLLLQAVLTPVVGHSETVTKSSLSIPSSKDVKCGLCDTTQLRASSSNSEMTTVADALTSLTAGDGLEQISGTGLLGAASFAESKVPSPKGFALERAHRIVRRQFTSSNPVNPLNTTQSEEGAPDGQANIPTAAVTSSGRKLAILPIGLVMLLVVFTIGLTVISTKECFADIC